MLPLPLPQSHKLTETESTPPLTLLFDEYPQMEDLADLAAQAAQEEEDLEEDHLPHLQPSWYQSPWLLTLNISEQDQLSSRETDNWLMHSSGNLAVTFASIKEYLDSTHPSERWPLLLHTLKD